jgi:hypothetical protein
MPANAGTGELLLAYPQRDELKNLLGLNRNSSRENLARAVHELLLRYRATQNHGMVRRVRAKQHLVTVFSATRSCRRTCGTLSRGRGRLSQRQRLRQ